MKIQNWTPQSLAAELRKNIIGQDNYLDDLCLSVWLHSLRIQAGSATGRRIRQPKMNLLVLGPSGSGKTSAVQKLAELLEIPLLIEDASHFTGSGWKGRDVSSIVVDIMEMGSEDPYYTIVVLDEIDKMFLNTDGSSGFAAQNQIVQSLSSMLLMTGKEQPDIRKASQQAAQAVSLNKVPVFQADLTNIQNQFMAVLREIKKEMTSGEEISQNMTKELTEQMFSELTKGQDLHHPSVSPEQLAAMVVQPISQMGLAEDESLAELQQALLHMMESMQPKQSDENDD